MSFSIIFFVILKYLYLIIFMGLLILIHSVFYNQLYLFILVFSPEVTSGRCFRLFCKSFDMIPFDLEHLLFGHRKSSRLILHFFLPQACNQPFLCGTLLLSSGEWCLESQIWMLKRSLPWGVQWHLSRVSGWMDTYMSLCVCAQMCCACIWEFLFLFPVYL